MPCKSATALLALSMVCLKFNAATLSVTAFKFPKMASILVPLFLKFAVIVSTFDKIAESFSVYHESPQVLVIRNGECIYDESHSAINMDEIAEQAA